MKWKLSSATNIFHFGGYFLRKTPNQKVKNTEEKKEHFLEEARAGLLAQRVPMILIRASSKNQRFIARNIQCTYEIQNEKIVLVACSGSISLGQIQRILDTTVGVLGTLAYLPVSATTDVTQYKQCPTGNRTRQRRERKNEPNDDGRAKRTRTSFKRFAQNALKQQQQSSSVDDGGQNINPMTIHSFTMADYNPDQ